MWFVFFCYVVINLVIIKKFVCYVLIISWRVNYEVEWYIVNINDIIYKYMKKFFFRNCFVYFWVFCLIIYGVYIDERCYIELVY